MDFESIAAAANLHLSTVLNFAYGTTRKPAARTLFQIAAAVDFRVAFIPQGAVQQPDEQDLQVYHPYIKKKNPK